MKSRGVSFFSLRKNWIEKTPIGFLDLPPESRYMTSKMFYEFINMLQKIGSGNKIVARSSDFERTYEAQLLGGTRGR